MLLAPPCPPGALAVYAARDEDPAPVARRMTTPSPRPEPEERAAIDADLLRRVARGDRTAFARLYDRFSRPLYATALRVLNDAREAEDVVQEVFLALWEKADTFTVERGTAFGWAVTLVRHRAIDRLRLRKRRAELLAASSAEDLGYGASGGAGDSADVLCFKEKAGAVRAAVAALPAEQQRALQLAFFGGLTQQEIAESLREPLGTVKARIRRGLLKLRETLAHPS
ncbi:MAG TPA: sigma-70 family RNA polymerase sigma factor [Opitutaceae bacterium]|nr:sigma-70 family RNA polymerase sigma factor [Opitutaceae bacterium]